MLHSGDKNGSNFSIKGRRESDSTLLDISQHDESKSEEVAHSIPPGRNNITTVHSPIVPLALLEKASGSGEHESKFKWNPCDTPMT